MEQRKQANKAEERKRNSQSGTKIIVTVPKTTQVVMLPVPLKLC